MWQSNWKSPHALHMWQQRQDPIIEWVKKSFVQTTFWNNIEKSHYVIFLCCFNNGICIGESRKWRTQVYKRGSSSCETSMVVARPQQHHYPLSQTSCPPSPPLRLEPIGLTNFLVPKPFRLQTESMTW